MKYFKGIWIGILVVVALGAVATTASAALPTALLLTGEKTSAYKGTVEGAEVAKVRSSLGTITASLFLASFTVEDMKELGKLSFLYKGTTFGGKKCASPGDSLPNGEILVDNAEYHLVLGLSGELLALILLPGGELKFTCDESFTFTVTGTQLVKVSPFAKETQEITIEASCASNTASKWTEYDNDSGTMSTAGLKVNVGLGPVAGCQEITKNLLLTTTAMGGEIMEP